MSKRLTFPTHLFCSPQSAFIHFCLEQNFLQRPNPKYVLIPVLEMEYMLMDRALHRKELMQQAQYFKVIKEWQTITELLQALDAEKIRLVKREEVG